MGRIPRKKIHFKGLQYLWERHKEIARRLVLGEQPVSIARDLGMSFTHMSLVCNSPAFERYLEALRSRTENKIFDIRGEINKGAMKGIQVLCSMLEDKHEASPSVKAKVAMDLLDRDGYAPAKKIEVENTTIHLTADRLIELKARRAQMLEQSKRTIEIAHCAERTTALASTAG